MLSYQLVLVVVYYFEWVKSESSSGPGPVGPISEITDYNFSPYAPSATNNRPYHHHHYGQSPIASRYESSHRRNHRSSQKTNSALSAHSHTSRYIKNRSKRRPIESSYYSSGSKNNLSNASRSRKHASGSHRHTIRSSRYLGSSSLRSRYIPKSQRSHRRSYTESRSRPSYTSRRDHSYPHYSHTRPRPSFRTRSSSYINSYLPQPNLSITSTGAPSTSFTPSQTTVAQSGLIRLEQSDTINYIINTFAANMFESLISNSHHERNVIISSLSIQTALTLLYCGAEGSTAKQLRTGLQLGYISSKKEIAHDFRYILSSFQNAADSMSVTGDIQIVNALYFMKGYVIRPDFKKIAKQDFFSSIRYTNFTRTKSAERKINKWVSKVTDGRISKAVRRKDLNSKTRLVLVNAIYFNGYWKKQFDVSSTCKQNFRTSSGRVVEIDMMYQQNRFRYLRMGHHRKPITVLKMDYYQSDVSMMIFLPKNYNDLGQLEQDFPSYNITRIRKAMKSYDINLTIPKFRIDYDVSLQKDLSKMGMSEIFSKDQANFDGIIDNSGTSSYYKNIYVSEVRHRARIEISEQGTKAVDETNVKITRHGQKTIAANNTSTVFKADHPFMFLLINSYDDILFSGRYMGV